MSLLRMMALAVYITVSPVSECLCPVRENPPSRRLCERSLRTVPHPQIREVMLQSGG